MISACPWLIWDTNQVNGVQHKLSYQGQTRLISATEAWLNGNRWFWNGGIPKIKYRFLPLFHTNKDLLIAVYLARAGIESNYSSSVRPKSWIPSGLQLYKLKADVTNINFISKQIFLKCDFGPSWSTYSPMQNSSNCTEQLYKLRSKWFQR